MKTPALFRSFPAALLLMVGLAGPAPADRTINYQSTLEAVNVTSGGVPLDATFTFELGTFTGEFLPTLFNTFDWLTHWAPVPNSSASPYSGATTYYSTDPVPFGGPANAFQGFMILNPNDNPFAPGLQGYFWGFDERQSVPAAEWVLLSNTASVIPTVILGEIEISDLNWLTSDPGTYSVTGSVNPYLIPKRPLRSNRRTLSPPSWPSRNPGISCWSCRWRCCSAAAALPV